MEIQTSTKCSELQSSRPPSSSHTPRKLDNEGFLGREIVEDAMPIFRINSSSLLGGIIRSASTLASGPSTFWRTDNARFQRSQHVARTR